MELDALDWMLAVADPHHERRDVVVEFVVCGRGDLEAVRDLRRDQGVVPTAAEPLIEPPEDTLAVVIDRGGLPVDRLRGATDSAAVGVDGCLQPQTDAEGPIETSKTPASPTGTAPGTPMESGMPPVSGVLTNVKRSATGTGNGISMPM